MSRRALITGVGGQDGSLLAELLLGEGYEVYGVARRAVDAYPNLAPIAERIGLIQSDLTDPLDLVRALRTCRRRDRVARGNSRGRSGRTFLPGLVLGDLRRSARVAADRGHPVSAADAVR